MNDVEYSCDKRLWRKYSILFGKKYSGRCGKKPHVEAYPGNGTWSYLCRWHYWLDRLKHRGHGYCILDGEDEQ